MIFNANFGPGDLTATFTFRKADRPKNLQEIKKLWAAYMVKLRYAYKKAGVEFKWMRAIETPDKNPHIHMALSRHRHSQAASVAVWAGGTLCRLMTETTTPTVGTCVRKHISSKGTKVKYNTGQNKGDATAAVAT